MVSSESPDLYNCINQFGHLIIYGKTNSGKTTLTKYLLKLLGFDDVYVFTTSPDYKEFKPSCEKYSVYSEEDEFNKCSQEIFNNTKYTKESMNCVIFDDFNNTINVQTNKWYKELFTRGRHKGIRIINLGHSVKSIGKIARNNTEYFFISKGLNLEEQKNVNESFLNQSAGKVQKLFQHNEGRDFILFNSRTNSFKNIPQSLFVDCDDSSDNEIVNTDVVNNNTDVVNNNTIVDPDPKSSLAQCEDPIYQPAINPLQQQIMQKNAQRDFVDNSNNHVYIQNNVKFQQRIEEQQISFQLQEMQLKQQRKLELIKLRDKTHDLLHKQFRTLQEIDYIIDGLSLLLSCRKHTITYDNMEQYANLFLKKYYPRETFVFKDQFQQTSTILPDVMKVGQQLVVANKQNLFETAMGITQIVKKYSSRM